MVAYSAFTTVRKKATAEALSDALECLKPSPIGINISNPEHESDSFEVTVFFDSQPDEVALALLSTLFSMPSFIVSEIPERDWVQYAHHLHPALQVGQFYIFMSHHQENCPDNVEPIFLEGLSL